MKRMIAILLFLVMALPMAGCAQEEVMVPDIQNIYQFDIPDNEAMAFLKKLGVGWNLGNTFDAIKQGWNANADEMTLETSWCGVMTTPEIFQLLKEAGYGVVRIPVSWHDHVSGPDHAISDRWMNRVQEVVDYALDAGLYVILNIHHDEDQFLPTAAHYAESAHYIECVWKQIAARFRDYDDHLIMESMNEPRVLYTDYEWVFDANNPGCVEAADCLNKLNQLFVDTVRADGGCNADRYLMVPGYDAAPAGVLTDLFQLPADTADNRIIVSAHAYTPYNFALQEGGVSKFSLYGASQTSEIAQFMNGLYNKFIANGIPAIIGEFGARDKKNLQDRVDFTAWYTAAASARNLPCLWWDNNAAKGNGELFCILNRAKCEFLYPQIVEAMIRYAGYDAMPAKE